MNMRFRNVHVLALSVPILLAVGSCSARHPEREASRASAGPPEVSGPASNDWRIASPSSQGMEGALLDAALQEARRERLDLQGMLVIRHGLIVQEAYFPPYGPQTPHELYSCTKSFVSALTGIAIQRGYLQGVSDPVLGFFPGRQFPHPDPRKKAMTVENLLTMSSGLAWTEADSTYRELYASSRDWVAYVLGQPMQADPGSFFWYSSGNSHVLSSILQEKTPKGTYEFAREALFRPIGIADPEWDRDPAGVPIGGWGLKLVPRDMARLGLLYLHDGAWNGSPVVPSAWVRASTRKSITATETMGYGYQWWIDESTPLFAALGRFGQGIFVVPSRDLVVVFTARIDSSDPELDLMRRFIVPACREAPPTRRGAPPTRRGAPPTRREAQPTRREPPPTRREAQPTPSGTGAPRLPRS